MGGGFRIEEYTRTFAGAGTENNRFATYDILLQIDRINVGYAGCNAFVICQYFTDHGIVKYLQVTCFDGRHHQTRRGRKISVHLTGAAALPTEEAYPAVLYRRYSFGKHGPSPCYDGYAGFDCRTPYV